MPIAAALGVIIRATVTAALGGLVVKGWLTQDELEKIITYVIGLGGTGAMIIWGILRSRLTSVLDRVAKNPTVTKIEVTDPDVVAHTGPKVVEADPDDLTF